MNTYQLQRLRKYISYEEVMNLSDEDCVYVNRVFLHSMSAKSQLWDIKDKKYWHVFAKYYKIELMSLRVHGNQSLYYLMSAKDIKYLLNIFKCPVDSKIVFLKSYSKLSDLNERHKKIEKEYNEKKEFDSKNEINNKTNKKKIKY